MLPPAPLATPMLLLGWWQALSPVDPAIALLSWRWDPQPKGLPCGLALSSLHCCLACRLSPLGLPTTWAESLLDPGLSSRPCFPPADASDVPLGFPLSTLIASRLSPSALTPTVCRPSDWLRCPPDGRLGGRGSDRSEALLALSRPPSEALGPPGRTSSGFGEQPRRTGSG